MKSLHVARTFSCSGVSFKLFTKAPNGKHQPVDFGTGSLSGGKVKVKVQGETLEFDSPIEAISRASQEGYAVVGS